MFLLKDTLTTISELTKRKLFFIAQKYFVKHNWKLIKRRKYDEKSNNYHNVTVLLPKPYAKCKLRGREFRRGIR